MASGSTSSASTPPSSRGWLPALGKIALAATLTIGIPTTISYFSSATREKVGEILDPPPPLPPPPPEPKLVSVSPQAIGGIPDIKDGNCRIEFDAAKQQFIIAAPRFTRKEGRTKTVNFGIEFHVKIAPKGSPALEPLHPRSVKYDTPTDTETRMMFSASEEMVKAGGIEIQLFSGDFKNEFAEKKTIDIVK